MDKLWMASAHVVCVEEMLDVNDKGCTHIAAFHTYRALVNILLVVTNNIGLYSVSDDRSIEAALPRFIDQLSSKLDRSLVKQLKELTPKAMDWRSAISLDNERANVKRSDVRCALGVIHALFDAADAILNESGADKERYTQATETLKSMGSDIPLEFVIQHSRPDVDPMKSLPYVMTEWWKQGGKVD